MSQTNRRTFFLTVFALCLPVFSYAKDEDAWRSNCTALENPAISPFLYFSQSDIAVLASYSDYSKISTKFNAGKKVTFFITPLCWIKGFMPVIGIIVESGTQKCRITPLSRYIEYPSLFFLRKKKGSDTWILLNSGEFSHQVDSRGILFGIGGTRSFPETCGIRHRRLSIDDKCRKVECQSYCNFKTAPDDLCNSAEKVLSQFMPKAAIPKERKPYYNEPSYSTKKTGKKGTKDKKTNGQVSDDDNDNHSSTISVSFGLLVFLMTSLQVILA